MSQLYLWLILALVKLSLGYSDVKVILYENDGIPAVHSADECESILFNPLFNTKKEINCACVTGVWAFYNSLCSAPYSVVGGNNYCFKTQQNNIGRVSLLSSPNSTYESTLTWMSTDSKQPIQKVTGNAKVDWELKDSAVITTGEFSWELTTNKGEKICLSHSKPKSYCEYSGLGPFLVKSIKQHCESKENLIQPTSCQEYFDANDEMEICKTELSQDEDLTSAKITLFNPQEILNLDDFENIIEPSLRFSRVKRQADENATSPATNATGPTPAAGGAAAGNSSEADPAIEDEDYIDPEQLKVENNQLVVEQLKTNLDSLIAAVTGSSSSYEPDLRMPILKLLSLCVEVMAKTCEVIDHSYYVTAFTTFVNIQTQSLHVKEPYITQTQYTRIATALSNCEAEARKHNFQTSVPANGTKPTIPTICDQSTAENATNILLKNNVYHNLTVEPDKSGLGFEPIIETVWKLFLNAHSYCYKYFSDYYNDHHTFAVTLLPLFTNEIQNIWMNSTMNGTYVEPKEPYLIYGGLIGDHRSVINNIDLCVAASRVGSAYPWLMNRPPRDDTNKWVRRKKRSVVPTDELCLKETDEANRILSRISCN